MGYLEDFEKNLEIQKQKLQKKMALDDAKAQGAKEKERQIKNQSKPHFF